MDCEYGKSDKAGPYQIMSNGAVVWVNDVASLLGRFGRGGVDIHRTLAEQQKTGQECLFCTHSVPTRADWDDFVVKMQNIYGVAVPASVMPKWLHGA